MIPAAQFDVASRRWLAPYDESAWSDVRMVMHGPSISEEANTGLWFFWDETQGWCFGPFLTHGEAEEGLRAYADTI